MYDSNRGGCVGSILSRAAAATNNIWKRKMSEFHPAPNEFSEEELAIDPILKFFHYAHLPERLQTASRPFCGVARHIIETSPRNAERTVALRKLLEAKDAAVRASLP